MLRTLVALLLLANLLFFAWSRGWLAPVVAPPHAGEREPERLAAQVRPEQVRVLRTAANGTGAAARAPSCLEAGPFAEGDVGIAEAALLAAGVPANAWVRETVAGQSWLRVARAEDDLRARLLALKEPVLSAPFGACRPR